MRSHQLGWCVRVCLLWLSWLTALTSYEFFAFGPKFEIVVDNKTHSPLVNVLELTDTKKMYLPWDKTLQHIPVSTSHCIDRKYVTALSPEAFQQGGFHIDEKHWWVHDLHPKMFRRSCWPMLAHIFVQKHTSEGGQDGVLEFIFHNIGVSNKYFVEFGWVKNEGANTYNLQSKHNFTGLIMDGSPSKTPQNDLVRAEFITPSNIVSLFVKYDVPKQFDYLSVDIDSADAWVLHAILKQGYRPRVITTEYNVNFPYQSNLTCDEGCEWKGCRLFGSSYGALNFIAESFGYKLVAVVFRLDLVFVRSDLLNGTDVPPNHMFAGNFGHNYLKSCVDKFGDFGREYIHDHVVDYMAFHRTGNLSFARESGRQQIVDLGLHI